MFIFLFSRCKWRTDTLPLESTNAGQLTLKKASRRQCLLEVRFGRRNGEARRRVVSVGETLAAFRECGGLPQTEERLGQALSCRAAQALPRSFHLPHTFGILSETARHDNRVANRSPTRRRRAAFVAAAAATR